MFLDKLSEGSTVASVMSEADIAPGGLRAALFRSRSASIGVHPNFIA